MLKVFTLIIILMSLWGFFQMKEDKKRAINKEWRISESKLITIAACGGAVGVATGMIVYWHKVKKPKFYILIPLCIIVHFYIFTKIRKSQKKL